MTGPEGDQNSRLFLVVEIARGWEFAASRFSGSQAGGNSVWNMHDPERHEGITQGDKRASWMRAELDNALS